MARTVVIGANGFIGSHLVDSLAAGGHSVTAFDRFSSQQPTFTAPGVRVLQGEFLSRSDLEGAVDGQDYVFHFLSTTSPATAESDPTLDIRTNVAQTVELLESAATAGIKRFYFASTGGAIYGPQGKAEYSEMDRALPISPYGIGKLSIEHYLHYFKATHGLESTALRISNPYGTRQKPNKKQGLIPIALRQISLGRPVIRLGNGLMVRDYVYVEDLVRMVTPMVGVDTEFDLYNLGSGIGYSVTDIINSLHRVTGIDFAVEERPAPPTFVDRVVLDTERYRAEFGTADMTELDEGVRLTYEEIRDHPND
ncbi:NAD-dependent epimerase/dehydratase family protein [Cryobacterium sp. TMT2-17-1]|uniref:NAD-dependent epimerase/dehydratase family protein n=1 Tax=unclassified Cryobacterium TaxID=2649013 RepID=UPI00106D1E36|nr:MULTISPECIES: NAD-dependent epimerase/dehydratase family protein [unclassified Cryobacterium]TFC49474.1 NAD-dependent epimerase/dehydratase family protein [Cryobacterium sp. TMT2-17-1]TFC68495.1 NAD-dependent epimerase/dehydratase family protein [Cryobacterium sp. TMT2-4]